MPIAVRTSPSGPIVAAGATNILSVFGRIGDVVAENGDYDTDQINNVSTVAGLTASEALDNLSGSSGIANASGVFGATVTAALNALLVGGGGGAGSIRESFAGGTAQTTFGSDTDANIGDLGWNFFSSSGGSVIRLPGELGAMGIRRVSGPATLNAFASLYLGAAGLGLFVAESWAACTWRARFDNFQGADARCQIGVSDPIPGHILGTGESAGFLGHLVGGTSSPNYQTVTSHLSAGNTPQDTGVPITLPFRNFTIVRVQADVIQFFIDGVLVTEHSTANGDGIPTGPLSPFASCVGGGTATFLDVDDFTFTPIL